MTEEDFLARWSRRKREVAKAETEPRVEAKPRVKEPEADKAQNAEPEFDIASLPPVESINALTDITAFLREGVPAELTRAALRRVWTADPAIRDFVGLAENAWDFTDPTAMPGFGPLESTDDVRRMIARIVDQIGEAAKAPAPQAEQSASNSKQLSEAGVEDQPPQAVAAVDVAGESGHEAAEDQVLLQGNNENTALQHDVAETEQALPKSSRRAHGGALPR
jgi:Protein of unknown function (DUF3306)